MMGFSKITPAKRTENITYAIRDIILIADEVKKSGKEMFYLNIGDPNVYDFDTPQHIIDAVTKAMNDNKNGYSPSSGVPGAIEAVRIDAADKGIRNIQDIFITTGAAEAIETCLTALLNPGENFLMPTPGYPLYTAVESKIDLEHNSYLLDEDNDWQPDIQEIKEKINNKTKAIVLINPNNPTGSVVRKEILEQIIEIAIEHKLVILSDEIYDKLIFGESDMISVASLNPDVPCVTFSGMSKNYMAPGFRLGWGIVSGKAEIVSDYVEAINKILRSRVSANHPEQYAIKVALQGDQNHLQVAKNKLRKRTNLISNKIKDVPGLSLVPPQGAYYAFLNINVENDEDFCKQLLRNTGVVVVPGSGFGQKPGTSHFRIVICPSEDILDKAFDLIIDFYKSYQA